MESGNNDVFPNLILSSLPPGEIRTLHPLLESQELPANTILGDTDKPLSYAYFLNSWIGFLRSADKRRPQRGGRGGWQKRLRRGCAGLWCAAK